VIGQFEPLLFHLSDKAGKSLGSIPGYFFQPCLILHQAHASSDRGRKPLGGQNAKYFFNRANGGFLVILDIAGQRMHRLPDTHCGAMQRGRRLPYRGKFGFFEQARRRRACCRERGFSARCGRRIYLPGAACIGKGLKNRRTIPLPRDFGACLCDRRDAHPGGNGKKN
jgi:hypothetical protein